jgi:hypothetical protein
MTVTRHKEHEMTNTPLLGRPDTPIKSPAPAPTSWTVLRAFRNGTRDYRVSDGVEVGVRTDGSIYWASDDGWHYVATSGLFDETTIRVHGDSTGWPSHWDSEYHAPTA